MFNSLFLFLVFLVPQILANTWVKLGTCAGWDYTNVDIWGSLPCSTTNKCETGKAQSPTKISSEITTTDGSLKALVFAGYGVPRQLSSNLMSYDGRDIWVDYYDQGRFENPGAGVPFTSRSIEFHIHNEQLGFETLNRMSVDIYHYEINNINWNNHPIGTHSISIIQMLFQIGKPSTLLDPFFQSMKNFKRQINKKNITTPLQQTVVSWSDFSEVFTNLAVDKANGYFRFEGSIPKPPCGETVEYYRWEQEWTISQAQFDIIKNLLGENQRPAQGAISKVPYFDPLLKPPVPFSFHDLSAGGIAAIVLAILFLIVALIAIIFGLFVKSSPETVKTF